VILSGRGDMCNHRKYRVIGFSRVRRDDGRIREFRIRWCPCCGAVFDGYRWVYPKLVKSR
jgi:hypothetical protein